MPRTVEWRFESPCLLSERFDVEAAAAAAFTRRCALR